MPPGPQGSLPDFFVTPGEEQLTIRTRDIRSAKVRLVGR